MMKRFKGSKGSKGSKVQRFKRFKGSKVTSYTHLPIFRQSDPVGKFHSVRGGGGEKDQAHMFGEQNDDFFPHHASLGVVDVVHFVEDDPL